MLIIPFKSEYYWSKTVADFNQNYILLIGMVGVHVSTIFFEHKSYLRLKANENITVCSYDN